jgi:dTDP-4-amino-4,6-dideoxygalactose transaminase
MVINREKDRTEFEQLKDNGYNLKDMEIIEELERKVAKFSGCKYGIAVDCCTSSIFLSLQYLLYNKEIKLKDYITIPKRTYLSVPNSILHCGLKLKFEDLEWSGLYQLKPTRIYDNAVRFTKDMYIGNKSLQCISFQYKKILSLGRGGMVLTDDKDAMKWLKLARFHGRTVGKTQFEDEFAFPGWNMYMMPADAARAILIFDKLEKINKDSGGSITYPDLSLKKIYNENS